MEEYEELGPALPHMGNILKSDISVHDEDFGKWEPAILRHKDPFDPQSEWTDIGSLGNIVPIGGLPKTMKTTLKQAIISSRYTDRPIHTLGFKLDIPQGGLIVDVDTEQSKRWCDIYYKNLATISGYYEGRGGDNRDLDDYMIFRMRPLNPTERVDKLERIVKEYKSDIMVLGLDGIADCLYDENNRTESKDLVCKLMEWTDKYEILLLGNIHTTEGAGYKRLTGVLGTELMKKMDASLLCHEHDFTDKKRPIVRIESWRTRGPGIDDLLFRRDRGLPTLVTQDN